jgi:flagellar motor switch protein FliN/FliY
VADKNNPTGAGSSGDSIGQDEIERLLQEAQAARGSTPTAEPGGILAGHEVEALLSSVGRAAPAAGSTRGDADANRRGAVGDGGASPGDIEFLLRQAEEALASVNAPSQLEHPTPFAPFKLSEFSGAPASTTAATLDLIRDVELNLKIELGRTHMYLEDVLKLRKGSVVPLDKLAGDPVDIYVNGRLIARGEVLVLNDNFAVRVAELIATETPA